MNFPLIFGFNYANITFGQQIGDWSNGMIGVSKTFGGSSILSSPAFVKTSELIREFGCFAFTHISFGHVYFFRYFSCLWYNCDRLGVFVVSYDFCFRQEECPIREKPS